MLKSIKHQFLKAEIKDRDLNASVEMLKEARKVAEKSIFIDANKVVANMEPASMTFMKKDIQNIAYSYLIPTTDKSQRYKVVAVLNKMDDKLVIYIYTGIQEIPHMFPLLGKATIDADYNISYKDTGRAALMNRPDIAEPRKELAYKILDAVFALLDYDYVLKDDVTKISSIAKLRNKSSYNNYVVTTRRVDEPVEIINTIDYKYEGSDINLEQSMLEELPFHKFYLKVRFIKETLQPIWILFDHGKLHALMGGSERSSKVSIGYVDLNEAKYGSPININVNKVKDFLSKDGYDIQDVAHMLNVCCRVFLEFMYKFNRLMPYSENVSNSFTEHVAHVVNNTSVHKIVVLNPESKKRSTQGHKGGKHASPREHVRIGHKRVYKSGIEIWVDEITVNEGDLGKITKTYQFADKE